MEHTAIEHYKERLTHLFQKDMPYIVLGSVVMVGLLSYASLAFYKNNYNIFAPKQEGQNVLSVNEKSENVARIIKEQNLDLITPSPTMTPTPSMPSLMDLKLPEQKPEKKEIKQMGEISALSTSQVTYSGKTYVVQEGDTLAIIAKKVYGDENAWTGIAEANGLWNPDAIYVGLELQIPR